MFHPTSNAILEWIYQVPGNMVRTFNKSKTYVGKDYPWLGILAVEEFAILSTKNWLKGYSLGQLIFGCDMIILIKHKVDWELIRQQKQTQINKYNIRENNKTVDHEYKVIDKFMLDNHAAYKYETPYIEPFVITQCWTNGKVTLQCGAKQLGIIYIA